MSEILTLEYNLVELPSSQHRAGLAGLVLMVDWLKGEIEKDELDDEKIICRRISLDETSARFEINQEGLNYLFDKVYGFFWKVFEAEKKPTKKELKFRTEKREDKTFYIYNILQPQGAFVADYDPTIDMNEGLWIKLWREMLFKVVRADHNPKLPFINKSNGLEDKTAGEIWDNLQKPPKKGIALSHSLFLTAQGKNAEDVQFKDIAKFQILLHFWVFVTQVYVPMTTEFDKKTEQIKYEFIGYSLSIPDVLNLKVFCAKLPKLLKNRSDKKFLYYPKESVVDIAGEGALDFMHKLNQRLREELLEISVSKVLLGIDVIHLKKDKKNVRLIGNTRINPTYNTDEYATIKEGYQNHLFRRQRMLNVLNERKDWFYGFGDLLSKTDSNLTIGKKSYDFRRDVRKAFEDNGVITKKGDKKDMSENSLQTVSKTVENVVYQLVENYIREKLRVKHKLTWKEEWKNNPNSKEKENYNKLRGKIARDAFLAVRSRTDSDFTEYFASTLCSYHQFSLKGDGFELVAKALQDENDKVRTLTMLALSANGYSQKEN